ncbi:hypothetical protein D0B54_17495 [Solimonas sp. K1W22B-7]|nr:hypothetical protein D0B54_17495 [Solimonas sp. K1W22B-7]
MQPLAALMLLLPLVAAAAEPAGSSAETAVAQAAPEALVKPAPVEPAAEPVVDSALPAGALPAEPTPGLTPAEAASAPVPPVAQPPLVPVEMQMTPGLGESLPPPAPPVPKAAAPVAPAAADRNAKGGKVRVPYLSETQRGQIKDELRAEILDQARRENWAQPESVPEWVRKVRLEGEVMMRYEHSSFGDLNGLFVNYQEANRTGPINTTLPPQGQPLTVPTLNTSEDRDIPKLRAKLGLGYAVSEEVDLSIRLTTGNTINPVSNNQTAGTSFNKPSLVLDRAYIRYKPTSRLAVDIGRSPNQFATGTDLIWDRDLSFDGIGLRYRYPLTSERVLRIASGFYSVENTDPNYPSSSLVKDEGHNKWMWGTQVELRTDFIDKQLLRAGAGFYKFFDVEGELSSPCNAVSASVACDTDDSRPGFMQKGNTVFQIRNTQPINPGDPDFQFFGLATEFTVLALSATWEMPLDNNVRLAVDFDAAKNLALDEDEVRALSPDNNLGPCRPTSPTTVVCPWEGGGDAWQAQLRVGRPVVSMRGDWQLLGGYRRIESDAVLDAFTDSDFHLGGTNAKGYYLGGSWAFSRSAVLGLRYFGANEISSQKLAIDVWQADVTVKF